MPGIIEEQSDRIPSRRGDIFCIEEDTPPQDPMPHKGDPRSESPERTGQGEREQESNGKEDDVSGAMDVSSNQATEKAASPRSEDSSKILKEPFLISTTEEKGVDQQHQRPTEVEEGLNDTLGTDRSAPCGTTNEVETITTTRSNRAKKRANDQKRSLDATVEDAAASYFHDAFYGEPSGASIRSARLHNSTQLNALPIRNDVRETPSQYHGNYIPEQVSLERNSANTSAWQELLNHTSPRTQPTHSSQLPSYTGTGAHRVPSNPGPATHAQYVPVPPPALQPQKISAAERSPDPNASGQLDRSQIKVTCKSNSKTKELCSQYGFTQERRIFASKFTSSSSISL
jgi:hypothetical protein